MNADEFCAYEAMVRGNDMVTFNEVSRRGPSGTLAYGYTTERHTWHAYTWDYKIHVLIYAYGSLEDQIPPVFYEAAAELPASILRPDKRVYPDTVDYNFATVMLLANEPLPFIGNFNFASREVGIRAARGHFKGLTHIDFGDRISGK